ncbi:hypothetical protein ACRCJU_02790 [Aerococcus urinaeequi]|uniref:hypothetical protein n=1 Tax=Aerococcus urinaeequi TaxID=51665 RepID=UPI003D6B889F
MTDNIKPDHYRTGEIDLFESWYLTYPFEQYRAIMQSHAEKYLRRNKVDRVEDLGKAIYCLKILREKEIEHAKKNTKTLEEVLGEITKTAIVGKYFDETYFNREDLLKRLQSDDYDFLTRHENGELWAHSYPPKKQWDKWTSCSYVKKIYNDSFPEVQWSDEEPTKIANLLETYENGGENGKVDGE